jgi:hypothetical protein
MPDSEVKVTGLRYHCNAQRLWRRMVNIRTSLGLALHAIGDRKSQQVLEQSLAIALDNTLNILIIYRSIYKKIKLLNILIYIKI